jgi:hypothetical protein
MTRSDLTDAAGRRSTHHRPAGDSSRLLHRSRSGAKLHVCRLFALLLSFVALQRRSGPALSMLPPSFVAYSSEESGPLRTPPAPAEPPGAAAPLGADHASRPRERPSDPRTAPHSFTRSRSERSARNQTTTGRCLRSISDARLPRAPAPKSQTPTLVAALLGDLGFPAPTEDQHARSPSPGH